MAEKKTSGTGRTRNYATVVYPESAPENWQQILEEEFVPAFISPLHNQDINLREKQKNHITMLSSCLIVQKQATRQTLYLKK